MFSKAKQMIEADRAVSPVIGVALMIGVTVLLGAVVGGFITGFGDGLNPEAPNAQIEFEYDNTANSVTILHGGGQAITGENTEFLIFSGFGVNGGSLNPDHFETGSVLASDAQIQSGDRIATVTLTPTPTPGISDVELVWVSPEGDTSVTLGEFTRPSV